MRIPIRLAAGESYKVTLNPRLSQSLIFGWAYFECSSGSGTIALSDGGVDQPSSSEVSKNSVFGVAMRSRASLDVTVSVIADSGGLQGALHMELIANGFQSDPHVNEFHQQ